MQLTMNNDRFSNKIYSYIISLDSHMFLYSHFLGFFLLEANDVQNMYQLYLYISMYVFQLFHSRTFPFNKNYQEKKACTFQEDTYDSIINNVCVPGSHKFKV